jgi:hypothetical protein
MLRLSAVVCLLPTALWPQQGGSGGREWRLLFDGKTFSGWQDPRQKTPPGDAWTIENGSLKAVPRPRIQEDLLTAERFLDFELAFEWRLEPGGNSGVKYRIWHNVFLVNWKPAERAKLKTGEQGLHYNVGYEFQIIDNRLHPDAQQGRDRLTGALYGLLPPQEDAVRPAGEWNDSRLLVRGSHIEHWLNGKQVLAGDLNSRAIVDTIVQRWQKYPAVVSDYRAHVRSPSPIALQNHGDSPAWFRNIRIRVLTTSR